MMREGERETLEKSVNFYLILYILFILLVLRAAYIGGSPNSNLSNWNWLGDEKITDRKSDGELHNQRGLESGFL